MKNTVYLLDAAANSLVSMGYTKLAQEIDSISNHIESSSNNENVVKALLGVIGLDQNLKTANYGKAKEIVSYAAITLAAAGALYGMFSQGLSDSKHDAFQKAVNSDLAEGLNVNGPAQTVRRDLLAQLAIITQGLPHDQKNAWNTLASKPNLSKIEVDSIVSKQFIMYGRSLFMGTPDSVIKETVMGMSPDIKNQNKLLPMASNNALDGVADGLAKVIIDGDLESSTMALTNIPGFKSEHTLSHAVPHEMKQHAKESFSEGISMALKEIMK